MREAVNSLIGLGNVAQFDVVICILRGAFRARQSNASSREPSRKQMTLRDTCRDELQPATLSRRADGIGDGGCGGVLSLRSFALAHAAAGDRDAALGHARTARQLAQQIHSDRHLRRLARLVLPAGQCAA
jgi:hypothetical protein